MEQIYFGQRIAELRRAQGMTQEALAQKLGITNQAVSKWEGDQCCPDIMQLPALADVFGISMDTLFGREVGSPAAPVGEPAAVIGELPWEDNNDLHAVCFVGHRLVRYRDIAPASKRSINFTVSWGSSTGSIGSDREPVVLEYTGAVDNIYSDFSVDCKDSEVHGNIQAGGSVNCANVDGNVEAGDSVNCANVGGNVKAGDGVICANVDGDVDAGDSVNCANVSGNVEAGDDVTCEEIHGSVVAGESVECRGSVGGNVGAKGDVRCGDIQGNAVAYGSIRRSGNGRD